MRPETQPGDGIRFGVGVTEGETGGSRGQDRKGVVRQTREFGLCGLKRACEGLSLEV